MSTKILLHRKQGPQKIYYFDDDDDDDDESLRRHERKPRRREEAKLEPVRRAEPHREPKRRVEPLREPRKREEPKGPQRGRSARNTKDSGLGSSGDSWRVSIKYIYVLSFTLNKSDNIVAFNVEINLYCRKED